jgi:hypothetical protein
MEISQGNSLYSYLKQKCHFFSIIKIRKQVLPGGLVPVGAGRMWGKDVGG